MRRRALQGFVALVATGPWALAGCGGGKSSDGGTGSDGGTPSGVPGFTIPAAPDAGEGFQIVLDPVTDIAPGGNLEYCTWTNIVGSSFNLKSVQAWQSTGGHHVILYTTTVQQPPGTQRLCQNSDTVNFQYTARVSGPGEVDSAPGDLYFPIPTGSQLVINHHYLNATPDEIPAAQTVINAYYSNPATDTVAAGVMEILNTGMNVGPGFQQLDIDCTVPQDVTAWELIPHMHQYGTTITITNTHQGSTSQLFDVPWNPGFTFDPPVQTYPVTAPFTFAAGDDVHMQCQWDNTSGGSLVFGQEMCVFFVYTMQAPGTQSIQCNAGQWSAD